MAFLRSFGSPDAEPHLAGGTVYLRPPVMADYRAWAELREVSRAFLTPWEPLWPADDLSRGAFRRRLRRYARERRDGRSYPFLLFSTADDRLIGGATLSNIRRGVSQSCSLGYWMGAPFAGQGYMSRAVALIVPFCFDVLHLHRIEAACLPHNVPSIRLLHRSGFLQEGCARGYLCINGAWQDHLLFACLADDPRPGVGGSPHRPAGRMKEVL
ncbi:GNAT family N-acetyltransferase [Polymorphum gilvum]|uniref:Putative ribosomal-protein-alanine N-acetyltransferase (RimJ-like) n=1 Tax=Polymorphum gilvum (strain LMG 25793 / CGMCC 1.9160 / SL003B-26A1) TaxID=991905 RepID=F2IZ85_POLGS|nr:GNAT family protein [Polymorphum gilvum]ADZ71808.1 Putative ribosomal-protein-alanine N-acetyltransferase (RimJ-like) [Polymorphum gilvum SL003B-26A1]